MATAQPFYGFDAPGVIRGMLFAAAAAFAVAVALVSIWPGSVVAAWSSALIALAGFVPLILGVVMIVYGLAGKFRVRDRMLDMVSWTGSERVLDIGTGAGLLLVGAAKRLTTGRATGIDIWSSDDLSNNARATTERNIALEGVGDRAAVLDGDARNLDFPAGSFDRVVSLLCLHNIPGAEEQRAVCNEIARVLAPGGTALIGDYVPTHAYADAFRAAGLSVRGSRAYFKTALGPTWIVVTDKLPATT